MEKIINCTPHAVSIYIGTLFDASAGHNVGGTEILSIPPSGVVATAKSCIEPLDPMTIQGVSVPTCKRGFASITELPSGGDFYVVSSVYAQAATELGLDTSKLLTPYGTVKGRNGAIIGCTGLVRN